MNLKKILFQLHLWLGLVSGLIVFVVCITGAIWVFNEEINQLLNPVPRITEKNAALKLPSSLIRTAVDNCSDSASVRFIEYKRQQPVRLQLTGRHFNTSIYIDPYSAEILKTEKLAKTHQSFFSWILNGHRFLWLGKTGRIIVNYSVLLFVLVLISGLWLWWPKTIRSLQSRVRFNWKKGVGLKRKLYDLHTVPAIYLTLFLLIISFTGMIWGIQWFSKGTYWLSSGGKALAERTVLQSDTTAIRTQGITNNPYRAIDVCFRKVVNENPSAARYFIVVPNGPTSAIKIFVYPDSSVGYNRKNYAFDQYSLKPLRQSRLASENFEATSVANQLRRMNFDLHVGTIFGVWGKLIAFVSALFGASLPLTGTWLYIRRQLQKKRQRKSLC